ncbi:hypothetical protein [Hydrogenophaga sp.]|uniref:hypothetical protein n=1 Tax=Hydrogenophaga sp. TaxID=1904254 RepID=UPI003F6C5C87
MAIPLGQAHFFSNVTAQKVLEARLALSVPDVSARRILKEVTTRLPAALSKEMADIRKHHAQAPEAVRVHHGPKTGKRLHPQSPPPFSHPAVGAPGFQCVLTARARCALPLFF